MTEVMQRPTATMISGAVEEADVARAIAEVQAQVMMAKRFPRDETAAYEKIIKACGRKSLAEVAQYTYPRGGTNVEGPSIRLAEVIARSWGNIQYGFRELGRGIGGYSDVEAYAWDLETNVRVSRSLQVAHTRDKRSGTVKLKADRDIYEHIASQAQRRVRACILEIIPGDVVEAAVDECNKALVADGVPMEDTIRQMVVGFSKLQVTKEMIEERLQHEIEICTPAQVASLRGIYNALKDGIASREQYFKVAKPAPEKAAELDEKVMEGSPSIADTPTETFEKVAAQFPCPHCDMVAKNQSGLTRHINSAHPTPESVAEEAQAMAAEVSKDIKTMEDAVDPTVMPGSYFAEFEQRCMGIQKRFQDQYGFDQGNEEFFAVLAKFDLKNIFEVTDRQDRQLAIDVTNALSDTLA